MKISVFSTKPYDRHFLEEANEAGAFDHELLFFEPRLDETTIPLALGSPAVCGFVNDDLGERVLAELAAHGTKLVALRCAGFNNVDLEAARDLGIRVMRVPGYSPYAVAEFTLWRSSWRSTATLTAPTTRVREGNFSLDGLLGFDLHARTAGIIGTGKIGGISPAIWPRLRLPRARLRPVPIRRARAPTACATWAWASCWRRRTSSACTARSPRRRTTSSAATPSAKMKRGAMLINTSRGGLIDTRHRDRRPQVRPRRHLGLDVYEEEARPLLRGPTPAADRGRHPVAPAHLPQRDRHRPPGLLHRGGDAARSRTRRWPTRAATSSRARSPNEVRARARDEDGRRGMAASPPRAARGGRPSNGLVRPCVTVVRVSRATGGHDAQQTENDRATGDDAARRGGRRLRRHRRPPAGRVRLGIRARAGRAAGSDRLHPRGHAWGQRHGQRVLLGPISTMGEASVRITLDTVWLRGSQTIPAPLDNGLLGQQVAVKFTGPVAESFPVQATAAWIRLLPTGASSVDGRTLGGRRTDLDAPRRARRARRDPLGR